eukprot:GHVP01048185.1.p1 GENE.GHVP01048185.1~~GHVP01048185.1.p1  ORF type:complete len:138 (-),score=19.75 GHVP01048185.1:266-679(-)
MEYILWFFIASVQAPGSSAGITKAINRVVAAASGCSEFGIVEKGQHKVTVEEVGYFARIWNSVAAARMALAKYLTKLSKGSSLNNFKTSLEASTDEQFRGQVDLVMKGLGMTAIMKKKECAELLLLLLKEGLSCSWK